MNGRHPDFTTSRLSIEATDTADGCIWALQKRERTTDCDDSVQRSATQL